MPATTRDQALETAHTVLTSALTAARRRDLATLTDDLAALDSDDLRIAASEVILRHLDNAIAAAWERGWQPGDLTRVLARRSARSLEPVLTAALAHEARAYRDTAFADADWVRQLDDLGARCWWGSDPDVLARWSGGSRLSVRELLETTVELLVTLGRLGPVARLRPPPSAWTAATPGRRTGPVDERLLSRVRALLDKAESTEFAEEGEALTAKAQELMARHSIDAAMLDPSPAMTADARRIGVDDPYARQKVGLLSAVGRANGCEVVYSPSYGLCTVFGTPRYLALVELLHASLLLQATRTMLAAGTQRDACGRVTTRSFRTSFLAAFAVRIGQRLQEATRTATAEAHQQHGSSLLPALARRDDAVRRLYEEHMPRVVTMRATTVSDGRGWSAGLSAADAADLSNGQRLHRPTRAIG